MLGPCTVAEAVAGNLQGGTLSYAELDKRANQLAHRLARLGVRAEVPVGVMMERSLELVVALLGVLKTGGAYVPMDPSYPPDRLALMMEDSEARLGSQMQTLAGLLCSSQFAEGGTLGAQAPVLLSQESVHSRVAVPTNAHVLLVRAPG